MFKNYFKIALRNLIKFKSYSFINIFGLSVGIASAILIFLFVKYELTFDTFHKSADEIFLIQKYRNLPTGLQVLNDTWIPLLEELKSTYPQVKNGVRLFTEDIWIETKNKKFKEEITFADQAIFDVFSFGLKSGNSETALKNKNTLVLSEEAAEKYFGKENPVGKTLRIGFEDDFIITGVLERIPGNSSMPMNMLSSFETAIDPANQELNKNWDGAFLSTFIQLKKSHNPNEVEKLLPKLVEKIWGTEGPNGTKQLTLKLLPLKDFHDSQFDSRSFAYILICIAAAIILIASFNFMNLSTARSMERIREIGMRKVLGAGRKQLIRQFLGESLILSFIALIIGICLAEFLVPAINLLYNISLSFDFFSGGFTLMVLLLLWLTIGIFSGSYPAFLLSRLPLLNSVKGITSGTGGVIFRKLLVTIQFVLSIVLICGTVIIRNQTEFMKNQNPNFNKENIVVIPVSLNDFSDPEDAVNKVDVFKKEILKRSGIMGAASSMSVPGDVTDANVFARPEGWESDEPLRMRITAVDENFFDVYKINLVEGRNFSPQMTTDVDQSIIINESAMNDMGWKSAVGKSVKIGRTDYKVIGVIKDYHTESLAAEVIPLIHFFRTTESTALKFLSLKIRSANISSALDYLKLQYSLMDPAREFDFFFLDDKLNLLYESQSRMFKVVTYFSIIAIIIACLGLLGLASYNITQRTKEIGIRKALGASVANIFILISKNFISLVLAANLLAWPAAFYLMSLWLQNFAVRISLDFLPFIASGAAAAFFAILTISIKAVKAATANPVNSLKYE